MRIGLIDADGRNFPNLPLMKLSAYHKQRGDTVELFIPTDPEELEQISFFPPREEYPPHRKAQMYDVVYVSKVFDFTPDTLHLPDNVIRGGTGCKSDINLPPEIEHTMPDYNLYPQYNEAYGFLTRGCPRKCKFCIVSAKEGCISKQVAELSEFYAGQKIIKLLDPNLLACKDHERLLKQLAGSGAWIDFTQGLDIRLVDKDLIQLLNKIKVKIVHFAWDNPAEDLTTKFELFSRYSKIKDYRRRSVYVLTNFNSTHEEDLTRIYTLRKMAFNPYVMIYDKQNAPQETRSLQRWVNNKRIFKSCQWFKDYRPELG